MTDPTEFDGDRYTQDDNLNVRGTLRVQGVPISADGGGMIATPSPVVDGNLIAYQGTGGALTQDSGINAANVGDVKSPASAALNRIAIYGATKEQLEEGSVTIAELGTVQTVSATVTNNALVRYAGTDGTRINDSSPGVATLDTNGDIFTPASVTQKTWVVTNFGKLDQIASTSITNPTSGRKIYANLLNNDNFTIRRPDGTDIDVEAASGGASGSNTQVQYNKDGLFAGSPGMVFDDVTNDLTITGNMSAANISSGGAPVVTEDRTITAGAGLNGGGDLSVDRAFFIAAADGSISVTAQAIAVGVLQGDAQHGQLNGGSNHSAATTGTAGFMSATDKLKLDGIGTAAENNTASNVGIGTGIFKQKNGVDLEFKTLTSANGLVLTGNTDEVVIDLPTIIGANRAILSNAAGTAYEASNLESSATATCWFLSEASVPGTGSIAIGTSTNAGSSDTTSSTFVGHDSAVNLGNTNDSINIFGRGNLNAVIPNNAMSDIYIFGRASLAALVAGSNVTTIGTAVGNNLTSGTRVTLMGPLSGVSMTSATDVHIYGGQSGPTGVVTDYVDLHDTLKMNISSGTVSIGGASNTKPIDLSVSLDLASNSQALRLNRINSTAETALTLSNGMAWYNNTVEKFRFRENGITKEILGGPSPGLDNEHLSWDASGNLQNSRFRSSATPTCWFANDFTVAGTGSMALGFNTNNLESDTSGSTMVGQNCCNKLGNNNNNITIVGRGALNQTIADSALSSITGIGQSVWSNLTSGSISLAIGNTAGNGVTAAVRSVIVGGLSAGTTSTSITDVGIYGASVAGPAGVVTDYVNFHNTLQMNTDSDTVTIGDVDATKPTNIINSIELASTTQVMSLNTLSQAQENTAAPSISDGAFWYNSTNEQYRGRRGGNIIDVSGFPTGYIHWPNGLRRPNSTTLRIESPLSARDDGDSFDFVLTSLMDASLIVDGVGGINTTQFPATANQFYNLRLLGDSTGVNDDDVELIELGTNPTIPTGYDKTLTLFPPALTLLGASWAVTAYSVQGNSIRTYLFQNESLSLSLSDGVATVNTTHVLNQNTTGTLLVPTGQRVIAHLNIGFMTGAGGAAGDQANINADETTTSGQNQRVGPGFVSGTKLRQNMDTLTDENAAVKYLVSDGTNNRLDIYVSGFTMSMRQ